MSETHTEGAPRRRRRPGENRERLLQAGIAEFAVHGYRGASTTEIAARAEVPQPHVYTNFRTKQELFAECVAQVCGALASTGGRRSADDHAAFLFQTIAALGEMEVRSTIASEVRQLRHVLGEQAFADLLLLGARSLMTRSDPPASPEAGTAAAKQR